MFFFAWLKIFGIQLFDKHHRGLNLVTDEVLSASTLYERYTSQWRQWYHLSVHGASGDAECLPKVSLKFCCASKFLNLESTAFLNGGQISRESGVT